jgi:subtilase family protein
VDDAFRVTDQAVPPFQVGELVGASWSGPFLPAYKISREIAAAEPAEPAEAGEAAKVFDFQPVMVHVLPDADLPRVVQAMQNLGAERIAGTSSDPYFSRVRLLLNPAEIAALRGPIAALREVFWIELEGRKTLLNDTTVWVGQSGLAGGQTTPIFSQGIFGEGQTVTIIDTGIDADACFFRDTALGLPPTNACNGGTVVSTSQRKVLAVDFLSSSECAGGIAGNEWDTHGHGSHVAGTVAGDDFANLLLHDTADGMAPGAWRGNVFSGGVSATGGTADRRNTLEQVLLAAPAAGTYTVTVRSFNVPNGPQPFALVVTGDAAEGAPPPPPVTVFADDFETAQGWTVNPNGTDTATGGGWERGIPEATSSSRPKQLATTVSVVNDLVTGRLAGANANANDVDGGTTSIQSPAIALPATGTLTLSFSSYFAHDKKSSTADFFRVKVVGATTSTVLQELGSTTNDNAAWAASSFNVSAFAGQTVRILIETADAGSASLVEAAVDDVKIVQQP